MGTQRKERSRTVVGVMTGSFHTDYSSLVVSSICDALKDMDVDICLFQGLDASRFLNVDNYVDTGFDDHYYAQFEYAHFCCPDLLVVSYCTISGVSNPLPLEEFLSRLPKVPTILLEVEADLPNCTCITVDNYGGMHSCVEHLIEEHGCRRILYLSGPAGVPDAAQRLLAWRDAMAEHGLPATEDMVAFGDFTIQVSGAVENLLDHCPHPDAIVCANDDMAEAVYRVLRRRGLEPGRDVAVTGFDDTANGLSPSLTSVSQNLDQVGAELARCVRSALTGNMPDNVRVPAQVFFRASCGCPDAKQDPARRIGASAVPVDSLRVKQMKQDHMLSVLMLRSLLLEHVDEETFFHTLGSLLWSLNTSHSRLALLPRQTTVDRSRSKVVPDSLQLMMEQDGPQVRCYPLRTAPCTAALEPFPPEPGQNRPCTAFFPLFYGSTHYGVFMVELEQENMLFYYTLSLEIGTGLRYLALSLAKQEAQADLEEKNQILKFSASHDALTGLYNRAGFISQAIELLRTQGVGTPCAVIMADLDHLKQINDTFGHHAGDKAICTVAETLARALPADSPLGRTGGDEFTALMLLQDGYSVEEFQQRIRQDVEHYNGMSTLPWYLGISVGCSAFVYSNPSQLSEELEKADQQLYQAKALRRSSVIRIASE